MDYRDKIITQDIAFCLRFKHLLNEWETGFIGSVDSQTYPVTQNQFNRLQEVTQRIANKLTPAEKE